MDESNNRNSERKNVYIYYDIVNTETGINFGRLVDISESGIKLVSNQPKVVGDEINITIRPPKDKAQKDILSARVICRWCQYGKHLRGFDSGFEFVDIKKEALSKIKEIINNFPPQF
jgi:hypothetical protein